MTKALRIIRQSWKNVFRNAWIGLATVFVFLLAFLSVNILLCVDVMSAQAVRMLEGRVDATVTFKPKTPDSLLTQAKFYLTSLPQTERVEIITAEQALQAFKQANQSHDQILQGLSEVGANPLGGQLVIKAKRAEDYAFLLQAVQGPQYAPFIEAQTYDDHAQAIETIRSVARTIQLIGSALVAIFAIFGLLIAFNAVRVAVYTQRDEIAIMRLVGAASWYIRAPFILETVWLVLMAAALSALIMVGLVRLTDPIFAPWFDGLGTGITSFYLTQWPTMVALQIGGLIVLVGIVAWAAVGRYIRR